MTDLRINRRGAFGDVLLLTPIIREWKIKHPEGKVLISTDSPQIFHGNPHVRLASKQHLQEPFLNLDMAYENRPGVRIIDAYAEAVGVRLDNERPELFPRTEDYRYAEDLSHHKKWIALGCMPTTWPGKNWPMHKWHRLSTELTARGYGIVLVGTGPRPQIKRHFDLTDRTTIHEMAAVFTRCEMFIGHDSFPMHCAIAMNCRTVGLFGITSPEIVLPNVKNALAVKSDPMHMASGLRHRVSGVTHVESDSNPMDTIDIEHVLLAVTIL